MSLKKGGGPKTLPTTLTITGQGSTDKLDLVYHNRKQSQVEARINEGASLAGLVPFLVESWDVDYELTEEGVIAFEDEYPGMIDILLEGFSKARRKHAEKN